MAEPANRRPGRNSRRSRPDGRPVRPPYLLDRRHRHRGAGVLRQRHLPTGRDQPRRPPPRPRLPQQDGVAGRRGVRLLRLANGGRRPAHAQDPRPPCRKVRLGEGAQRHRSRPVRNGHTARRTTPTRRVLHPRLAGQDHGARGGDRSAHPTTTPRRDTPPPSYRTPMRYPRGTGGGARLPPKTTLVIPDSPATKPLYHHQHRISSTYPPYEPSATYQHSDHPS